MLKAILLLSFFAADDKEAEDALERFKTAYKGAAAARAAAVKDLARVQHEKTLTKLEGILGGEEMPVRIEAARGLGNFTDYKKKVTPVLLSVLAGTNKDTVSLAEAIFEALGKLGDESSLESVHKHFDDKEEKVVKAALGTAGDIKSSKSIDPIIELMKKYEKILGTDKNDKKGKKGNSGGGIGNVPYGGGGGDDPQSKLAKDTLPACIKALTAITKEKWTTSQEWIIWWNRHKGDSEKK